MINIFWWLIRENILRDKSFAFSVRVVRVYQFLTKDRQEWTLSKQVLRCGTSIGAMVRESEYAQTRADFIHKLSVAQKEANESLYWLELLAATDYLTTDQATSLSTDVTELLKIITSSIKTAKESQKNKEKS